MPIIIWKNDNNKFSYFYVLALRPLGLYRQNHTNTQIKGKLKHIEKSKSKIISTSNTIFLLLMWAGNMFRPL